MKKTTLQDVLNFTKTMKESMAEDVFQITNERDIAYNLGALEAIEAVEAFIKLGIKQNNNK